MLPAADFQAAISAHARIFRGREDPAESRLPPGLAAPQRGFAANSVGQTSFSVVCPAARQPLKILRGAQRNKDLVVQVEQNGTPTPK